MWTECCYVQTTEEHLDKVRSIQTLGNDNKDACWTAKVAFIRVRINVSLIFVISLGLVM